MSKVALALALGLLLFFTWITGIKGAYPFAYALWMLFLVAWAWPRFAIRGLTITRKLDPGTPTVDTSHQTARGEVTQRARHARTNPYTRGLANNGNREMCHDIENKSSLRTARSNREHASLAPSPSTAPSRRREALPR